MRKTIHGNRGVFCPGYTLITVFDDNDLSIKEAVDVYIKLNNPARRTTHMISWGWMNCGTKIINSIKSCSDLWV